MATIKLVPSAYYLSSSTYLSVSNADNMYANTDSTNYATVYNSRSSTSSYYIYLRGFNFDAIPSAARVSSFTIRLKAYESGVSTSSSYEPYLANGTSIINGSCSPITTSATVHTFSGITADWDEIASYGDNFGIRINCRRASRNTAGYVYIFGAEIEVEYTIPDPRTVTISLNGNGSISPSGSHTYYDGDEVEVIITPTNKSDEVTATHNGTDVTSQLVEHGAESTASAAPNDVTTSGVQSGTSYMNYAVGHTAESPSSSGTSSNAYASSGSTGYAAYSFDLSAIPSGAVIESISASVYGHRENSSIDSTHVSQCAIYSGSTAISDAVDFPSTSNSTIELEATTMPSSVDNLTIRHYVGYYGGLVLGITLRVTYSTGTGLDHYTYTFTVTSDATIAVTIGGSGSDTYVWSKASIGWARKTVKGMWKKTDNGWQTVSSIPTGDYI